jgi:hypothetical protein
MSQEQVPDDFNWVAAQAKCSAALMFERLRAGVREDVQRRNSLFDRHDGWKFEFHDDGDGFEAVRVVSPGFTGSSVSAPVVSAVVRFERAGRRIQVQGEDIDIDLTAVVTLDVAGLCLFVVDGSMYSEWELRRMALELLFFEETDESE